VTLPIDPAANAVISESASEGIDATAAIRVEVTRIHHYARNPRRHDNPEYDRIKASIRTQGLDQPLVITQEPGSEDYVLQAGGNTRLRILKELYQDTGDERFYWVNGLFKPWAHESNLLLAHLRENELRGNLLFIDKAQAVFEAKQLLEAELEVETLTQRQLETLFQERGFSVSHSLISQMGYAVHTLWPLIPNALSAGLGRPQVEKIRTLERVARRIWARRALGDEALFDMIFAELCRRYDDVEWDFQLLRAALENEIAQEAEQSLQAIRLEMDACLAGKEFVIVDHPVENEIRAVEDDPPVEQDTWEESPAESDVDHPESHPVPPQPTPKLKQVGTVQALRAEAWTLAAGLAERNGLAELVFALPDQGLGFLLGDVPDPELTYTLDQAMLGQVSTLWWQLAACAELTVAPVECLMPYLKPDTVLREALAAQDAGMLFNSVWTVDPGHTGHQLWQQLSEPDWQDLLALMATYRALKRQAMATGTPLWVSGDGKG
tara:strand:- start:7997 stop:9481 length:1485 start_codon:yes stop_codon:yes gene_type:complete